jgi:hypothetical protein
MSNCSTGKEPRGAQLAGRKKLGPKIFLGSILIFGVRILGSGSMSIIKVISLMLESRIGSRSASARFLRSSACRIANQIPLKDLKNID